jgi:hypothetical protein
MTNTVANADARTSKADFNQLITNLRAELDKMKGGLQDELDKVLADAEKLRASNLARREELAKAVNG